MKIAVIDDDQKEREYLTGMIESQLSAFSCTVGKIDAYGSAEEFLDVWIPYNYGLILLDIYMDGMDGIDTARKIRERDREARLVFCTSGNEFASESYEVGARYYLRKPVTEKGVKAMLDRLNLEEYELNRFLVLPDGQQVILRNIIYTEYYNHVVTIHNKKGADMRTRISQAKFTGLLREYPYFRSCSKGIMVNFYEVSDSRGSLFEMSNGEIIYLSRRKEKEVRGAYVDFCFERMRKEMRE